MKAVPLAVVWVTDSVERSAALMAALLVAMLAFYSVGWRAEV